GPPCPEHHLVPDLEPDRLRDDADPDLRPAQVGQQAHAAPGRARDGSKRLDRAPADVRLVAGAVDPPPIQPLLDHAPKDRGVAGGRAERGDDVRAPERPHTRLPWAAGSATARSAPGGGGGRPASGCRSAARISTPSTRRGPGRLK